MKKHFLFIIMLMAILMPATAQVKKIAILDVVDREGNVPYAVKMQIRSNLTYAISRTPGYEAYDRVDMASIMKEQDFQRTGLVNDEQIRKLGEMTGCSFVLVTEAVVYRENKYKYKQNLNKEKIIVTAKILNVETANIEKSTPTREAYVTDNREIKDLCYDIARSLVGFNKYKH